VAVRAIERLRWRARLFLLSRRGGQRVALASFPRSGNTWFRFLLENATGEQTGNASDKVSRILPRSGDGIVIKTHRRDSFRYTHAIHLVRNPFDVIDSFYDWKASLGWEWKYGEVSWEDFVRLTVPLWRQHTRHWLDARPETYLIRYEDCVRDPVAQFGALLDWLGRPVPERQLVEAVERTSFERLKRQQAEASAVGDRFFRRGKAEKGFERFSPEQRKFVLDRLTVELERCGYSHLNVRGEHRPSTPPH
jgi:hypothetical protein